MKKGVTIIELLIVIVIIAILSAIAIPLYTNRIEMTYGERAIANIEIIKDAYKQYYIKHYTDTGFASPAYTTLALINSGLELDIQDTNFSYSITAQTGSQRIEAVRNAGIYNGNAIRYNLNPIDNNPDGWDTTAFSNKWTWHPV